MISVNFRDARPLYEQLKENIIKLIMTHALAENEKLPSVRELATTLAINPNTIQRAYRELENEGYIYVAAGRGAFVAPYDEAKADIAPLMKNWRDLTAKLLFGGVKADSLKSEMDKIDKEVHPDD